MNIRRWLYLTHRWLGITMCLLLAMWFSTGVVMMYVGYPSLTEDERLASLPLLDAQAVRVAPRTLLQQISGAAGIADLRLSSVMGRPAYLLRTPEGSAYGLFADTGEAFEQVGVQDAVNAAQVYADNSDTITAGDIAYLAQLDMDQWSISSAFDRHRPLHLVALNDAQDTRLYVSSHTGEILRDTSAHERLWNWLGANLHWIYPMQLRRYPIIWHWVVVVLSLAGLLAIASGAMAGLMRLRLRKPYRGKNVTPYHGTMKLHHMLGLILLLPLATYMFSGLMSMNPWGVFSDKISYREQHTAYRGSPTVAAAIAQSTSLSALQEMIAGQSSSREVLWQWLDGEAYHYIKSGNNQRQHFMRYADQNVQQGSTDWMRPGVAQLQKIMGDSSITAIEKLDSYDSYYYSHRNTWRPLPALRVRFDDPATTWFHLDLTTGEMLNRLTSNGRVRRWIYHGLHSLDFIFLIRNRPLWDVVVISLSIVGFVFSVSAVTVGWWRMRRRSRH